MIGALLTGPRRVGKTSLLLEAKRRLARRGVVAVYASARRAPFGRLDEFIGHLIVQTLESFRGMMGLGARAPGMLAMGGGTLADFLKGAGVSAEVGEGIARALSFARGESPYAAGAVSDAFMLPDRLAVQCGRRCALIIDEFPSLADLKAEGGRAVGGSIMRAVRTFHEEYMQTVLAVSGSTPRSIRGPCRRTRRPCTGSCRAWRSSRSGGTACASSCRGTWAAPRQAAAGSAACWPRPAACRTTSR